MAIFVKLKHACKYLKKLCNLSEMARQIQLTKYFIFTDIKRVSHNNIARVRQSAEHGTPFDELSLSRN